VTSSIFQNNTAIERGGCFSVFETIGHEISFSDSYFEFNSASVGGCGSIDSPNSLPTFENCIFFFFTFSLFLFVF